MRATITALALALACTGPVAEAPAEPVTARDEAIEPEPIPPPPEVDVAVERACGELGATPTPLPPGLAGATTEIGRTTLAPGGKARIGNVDLVYAVDMMFGTRNAFTREDGLTATIDRTLEPIDGAYGGHERVGTGEPFTFEVGRYRIVAERHGTGTGPSPELDVIVRRRGCPGYVAGDWPGDVASVWLGTTAVRAQTLTDGDRQVQLTTRERGVGEKFELHWTDSGSGARYGDSVELTPAAIGRTFEGVTHEGTIAAIEPGPGVTFRDGHWRLPGDARGVELAVRVDMRRKPRTIPPPSGPERARGCGEPRAGVQALPEDAARPPVARERLTVTRAKPAWIGTRELRLLYEPPEPQPGARRDIPERWTLSVIDPGNTVLENTMLQGRYDSPRVRVQLDLFQVEPATSIDPLTIRRFTVACPEEHRGPLSPAAHDVWLATTGLTFVELTSPGADSIFLQLQTYEMQVNLLAGRGTASYSHGEASPDAAGDRFAIGDREVEILEIVGLGATTWDGKAWRTTDPDGPRVLAHVRIGVGAGTSGG